MFRLWINYCCKCITPFLFTNTAYCTLTFSAFSNSQPTHVNLCLFIEDIMMHAWTIWLWQFVLTFKKSFQITNHLLYWHCLDDMTSSYRRSKCTCKWCPLPIWFFIILIRIAIQGRRNIYGSVWFSILWAGLSAQTPNGKVCCLHCQTTINSSLCGVWALQV